MTCEICNEIIFEYHLKLNGKYYHSNCYIKKYRKEKEEAETEAARKSVLRANKHE